MTTLQAEIQSKINSVVSKLESLGYPRISIDADITKLKIGCTGRASSNSTTIQLSSEYLNYHKEYVMNQTIPHEICHLYQFAYHPRAKQAHGPEFRRLMMVLGLQGNTCHNLGLAQGQVRKSTRVTYKCACQSHEITKNMAAKIEARPTAYFCKSCKKHLTKYQISV